MLAFHPCVQKSLAYTFAFFHFYSQVHSIQILPWILSPDAKVIALDDIDLLMYNLMGNGLMLFLIVLIMGVSYLS